MFLFFFKWTKPYKKGFLSFATLAIPSLSRSLQSTQFWVLVDGIDTSTDHVLKRADTKGEKSGQTIREQAKHSLKKSRIRETKHLSTNANNSTDAIGGWSKNTQKPDNPSGSVVSTMFCKAKSAKKPFFARRF